MRTGRTEYPVVPAQRLFHTLERTRPGSSNLQRDERLVGDLDLDALRAAARLVVQRHGALRTAIKRTSTRFPPGDWRGEHLDLRQVIEDEVEPEIEVLSSIDELRARRPFRLSSAPLIRFGVVRLGPKRHAVGLTVSHAVSDYWSQSLLWRDLGLLYDAELGRGEAPPPLTMSFGDHSAALLRDREAGGWDRHVRFWQAQLRDLVVPKLPARCVEATDRCDVIACYLDDEERSKLQSLATHHRASTFAVLLALYAGALNVVFGWVDLYVFTPYANRRDRSTWDVVGPYANVVMLRFKDLDRMTTDDRVRHAWRLVFGTVAHGGVTMDAVAATRPVSKRAEVTSGVRVGIRQLGLGPPSTGGGFDGFAREPVGSPEDSASTNGLDLHILLDAWTGAREGQLRLATRADSVDPAEAEEIIRLIRAGVRGAEAIS